MFWFLCLFILLPGLGCQLCSEEHGCAEDGSNVLYIVSGLETESACQELCAATRECRVYTWYGLPQLQPPWYSRQDCVLLRDCGQHTPCQDCHTGPPQCSDSDIGINRSSAMHSQNLQFLG